MDYNLDDIDEVMDFVAFIFEDGRKVSEKTELIVGYWQWKRWRVVLFGNGDVQLMDDEAQKSIQIFNTDRNKNSEVMMTKGQIHRMFLIKQFLSSDNLVKLENMKAN